MHVQLLTLENFRTYEEIKLNLNEGNVHLFVGCNGVGKTNLLESMSFLSGARSFLGVDDHHVMQWGKNFFRVRGGVYSCEGECTLEIVEEFSPRVRKKYFVNDAPVSLRNFVGKFPTVSFLPQDLDLFTGSPALRRRFMDRILCQTSPEYLQQYIAFHRCLKQRNALLRRIAKGGTPPIGRGLTPKGTFGWGGGPLEELLSWDHEISLHGSFITLARLSLIQSLTVVLQPKLFDLGFSCDHASLTYERQSTANGIDELQREFEQLLKDSHERDIRLSSTSIGPHRDDWICMVNGRSVETWMSRGEQRLCVVTLFLLQAAYMAKIKGERPMILLDDVFSELDTLHQQLICETLADHQILITSTHPPPVDMGWQRWEVEKGRIQITRHNFVPSPLGGGTGRGGQIVPLKKEYSSTPSP